MVTLGASEASRAFYEGAFSAIPNLGYAVPDLGFSPFEYIPTETDTKENPVAKKNSGKTVKKVPDQFDPAESVEELAKQKLIPKYHTHLVNAKIAYLFKNKPLKVRGKLAVATAEKVNKKNTVLSGYHFIITVGYPTWNELSDPVRLAVLDHELCHCLVDDDEDGNPKYSIVPHDIEEFSSVIMRHGLYAPDLVMMGRVVSEAKLPDNLSEEVVVKKVGKPDEDEDPIEAAPKKSLKIKRSVKTDDDDLLDTDD